MTEAEILYWRDQAKHGDMLEYHRGFLAIDRDKVHSELDDKARYVLGRVATRLYNMAERGHVRLIQHREGKEYFVYIAIAWKAKRSKRR